MQDVIFREEYNRFSEKWGFLAIFPETEASVGRAECVSFIIEDDGRATWEPFGEADLDYLLSKKIVHKDDDRIPQLKELIEKHIGDEVNVVERITEKHRQIQKQYRDYLYRNG